MMNCLLGSYLIKKDLFFIYNSNNKTFVPKFGIGYASLIDQFFIYVAQIYFKLLLIFNFSQYKQEFLLPDTLGVQFYISYVLYMFFLNCFSHLASCISFQRLWKRTIISIFCAFDFQCSVIKIKVLDAIGPPGLPSLLATASKMVATTAISALSFSPDGEVLNYLLIDSRNANFPFHACS